MPFYKYYTFNKNSLSCLTNEKLWLSRAEDFNDIFECHHKASDLPLTPQKILKEQVFTAGITCFSKPIQEDQAEEVLMWGHYADSHRGFRVEYKDSIQEDLQNRNRGIIFDSVSYPENHEIVEIKRDSGFDDYKRIIFTKSHHWQYENEWRLFVSHLADLGRSLFPFSNNFIEAVTFGARMTGENKTSIYKLLSHLDINFKVCEKNDKKFAIEVIPYIP